MVVKNGEVSSWSPLQLTFSWSYFSNTTGLSSVRSSGTVVEGPSLEKLSLVYTMEGSGKVRFILVSSCVIHILRRYSYRRFRENLWLFTPFIQKVCHGMIKRTKFRQKHREKKKSVPIKTYIMLLFWSTPCNAIVGQERKWLISARPSSRVLTFGGIWFEVFTFDQCRGQLQSVSTH